MRAHNRGRRRSGYGPDAPFRDFLPDRQQHIDHVRRGDSPSRKVAQLQESMALEAREPLAGLDGAFPAGGILAMILACGVAKRHFGGSFAPSLRKHIATVDLDRLAKFIGFLSRLRERKQLGAAQADILAFAVTLQPKKEAPPRLSTFRNSPSPS